MLQQGGPPGNLPDFLRPRGNKKLFLENTIMVT